VEGLGVQCLVQKGDVRKDADIIAAVTIAIQQFQQIDILFNNWKEQLQKKLPNEVPVIFCLFPG
jgi:NADP-dependent 3-hydroxy acid dehydrogenase YdfG